MKERHEQVIEIRLDEVRALGFLPKDVEVIGVITPQADIWRPEPRIYLRIRCGIAFLLPEGSQLIIERLFDFYSRYTSINGAWVSDLNQAMSIYQGG